MYSPTYAHWILVTRAEATPGKERTPTSNTEGWVWNKGTNVTDHQSFFSTLMIPGWSQDSKNLGGWESLRLLKGSKISLSPSGHSQTTSKWSQSEQEPQHRQEPCNLSATPTWWQKSSAWHCSILCELLAYNNWRSQNSYWGSSESWE